FDYLPVTGQQRNLARLEFSFGEGPVVVSRPVHDRHQSGGGLLLPQETTGRLHGVHGPTLRARGTCASTRPHNRSNPNRPARSYAAPTNRRAAVPSAPHCPMWPVPADRPTGPGPWDR